MPRYKSALSVYEARLRNLRKARAAKKAYGGRRVPHRRRVGAPRRVYRRRHVAGRRAPHRRVAYRRVHRSHRRQGGFLAPLVAAHGILQSAKPFTNGEKFAEAVGLQPYITRALDRLGFVGTALRGVSTFGKRLGYGPHRRRRVVHHKVYRARRY